MKKLSLALLVSPFVLLAASATAQGIKWHPGHYVQFGAEDSEAQILRNIDAVGNESAIAGVQVKIRWVDLEKSKGVYDFSAIDAYLKRVKAQPTRKQLVVRIVDRNFKATSRVGIVPSYLLSGGAYGGGVAPSKTGYVARLWDPDVMTRLIALHRAIARRYDDDNHFEGQTSEETTLALASPLPWDYSHGALVVQYHRLVDAVRAEAPRSNFFLYTNWVGSSALMDDLMQGLMGARAAAGGPDVLPWNNTLAQQIWTGEYGADYRWALALASSVEISELTSYTPKQIGDWAFNQLHLHYVFWTHNTWAGNASQRWDTGILPYLRTKPPVRTRCPDSYGWCMRD